MNRCVVLALLAVMVPALGTAQDKPGGGFDPAKAMAEMQRQFLQQFDLDRDGKLSPQENRLAQEVMGRQGINMGIAPGGFPGADQFAKQFDRDGDGKLNPMEAAAAQAAFQRMRNNGGGPRGGGGGGGSALPQQPIAPAEPPADKKSAKVNPLVKRFDKDGDGKLNAEEKAAAQAEFKKEKGKDGKVKDGDGEVKDEGKAKDEFKKEKPAKKAEK
jgi:Ca2+-binding EF-hand superfamily protein